MNPDLDLRDAPLIERGAKAEKLLRDPLLLESFEMVKQALMKKWELSPTRDKEGREYLYLMIKAVNDSHGYLEQAIRDGKVALHSRQERSLFDKVMRR